MYAYLFLFVFFLFCFLSFFLLEWSRPIALEFGICFWRLHVFFLFMYECIKMAGWVGVFRGPGCLIIDPASTGARVLNRKSFCECACVVGWDDDSRM